MEAASTKRRVTFACRTRGQRVVATWEYEPPFLPRWEALPGMKGALCPCPVWLHHSDPRRSRAWKWRTGSIPERRGMTPKIACPKRSEEHTSELQSLMRISYAVFCLKKKIYKQ